MEEQATAEASAQPEPLTEEELKAPVTREEMLHLMYGVSSEIDQLAQQCQAVFNKILNNQDELNQRLLAIEGKNAPKIWLPN